MRINSISPYDLLGKYALVRERTPAQQKIDSGADKAELTKEAKAFSATLRAAKEVVGTRTIEEKIRINKIAEEIRNNTYSVPGLKVAEKILGK